LKTKLKTDYALFQRLKSKPPQWWSNLKSDPELYIDVRKDNYLNVYYNGGSIMKLEGSKEYKAQIHYEYIPLHKDTDYLPYDFQDENIDFREHKPIKVNNFSNVTLEKIKKRISKFYPNNSEKGIQGHYVVTNNRTAKDNSGFFIDTEFMYDNMRIDMIWVDLQDKKIALVELKKIADERLYVDKNQTQETIDKQLRKYYEFAKTSKDTLIQYYNQVYSIKRDLGLLPEFVKEQSLENYELIQKPILLVGDCTQKWIDKNADDLNDHIKNVAFGSLYHGKNTYNFRIPF
jgi:hypothetical protein